MTRFVSAVAAGLALLTGAGIASAQPAQRPETFPSISIYGMPEYVAADAAVAEPMRRATPTESVSAWLPETDPAVGLARIHPDGGGGALDLQVASSGTVTSCRVAYTYGDKRLMEGVCDRVLPRVKMKPAIDETGAPVDDSYTFLIAFGRSLRAETPIVKVNPPPPAPPLMEASWPPTSDSLTASVTKLDLLAAGPASPQAVAEPWTGIVYAPDDAKQPCRIQKSSGDKTFDERACKAAAKGKYVFPEGAEPYRRRMQLHIVLDGGKPRALLPVRKGFSLPQPTETGLAVVSEAVRALPADQATKVRLNVDVAPSGAVTRCGIEASSGTDAGDVAACAAVRKAATFIPGEDIFGRPRAARLYNWNPLGPARR